MKPMVQEDDRVTAKKLWTHAQMLTTRNDIVAIYPEDPDKASPIAMSHDANKEDLLTGYVVAVGPGKFNDKGQRNPVEIPVGARVAYRGRGRTECDHLGYALTLITENWIFAILEYPPQEPPAELH